MRLTRSSLAASAVALAAVAAVQAPVSAAGDPVVDFTFDSVGALDLPVLSDLDLTNLGSAATGVSIVSSGDGVLRSALGADGGLDAVRFPYFDDGLLTSHRAVVAVTGTGATDELAPGAGSFSYGADFRLAGVNHGTDFDNGNNVIQRGLYNQSAQFKLQIDGGTAGCRVLGDEGDLIVKTEVPTREWYSVTCSLARGATDTLTISAAPIDDAGVAGSPVTESVSGPVGPLTFDADVPLSVGGKLTNALDIMNSSDQFNGRIDRAFLSIG